MTTKTHSFKWKLENFRLLHDMFSLQDSFLLAETKSVVSITALKYIFFTITIKFDEFLLFIFYSFGDSVLLKPNKKTFISRRGMEKLRNNHFIEFAQG